MDSWLCFPKLEAAKPDRISLSGIASVDMAARGFFFFADTVETGAIFSTSRRCLSRRDLVSPSKADGMSAAAER